MTNLSIKCPHSVFNATFIMRQTGCHLVWTLVLVWWGLCVCVAAADAWDRPGCHLLGHRKKVSIPDCVEFHVTTNACRGYCESWAIPSPLETMLTNPHQPITSIGQCCVMMETEDVVVEVLCLDGIRDVVFKSARRCDCFHCKKD